MPRLSFCENDDDVTDHCFGINPRTMVQATAMAQVPCSLCPYYSGGMDGLTAEPRRPRTK